MGRCGRAREVIPYSELIVNSVCKALFVRDDVRHRNWDHKLTWTRTSILNEPRPGLFWNTHTNTQCSHVGWVTVFALQKFESARFYSVSQSFFPLCFLMEKEEQKMKSIFNVYRGAALNSFHSAQTILNKLIFNEQPLCLRVKEPETLVLAKGKTNLKLFQMIVGRTASLWAIVILFASNAYHRPTYCIRLYFIEEGKLWYHSGFQWQGKKYINLLLNYCIM